MNMVRNMLSEKHIPKTFWPEAVNWTLHELNRFPTLAVKDMTPQEAWSGEKPKVDYFRVFGCLEHVHIPDSKRTKLDNKSFECILLGISEESKAYRLYDPISKKVVISQSPPTSESAETPAYSSPSSDEERARRRPSWMEDYTSGEGLSRDEGGNNLAMFTCSDPTTFEEASKVTKWRAAMDLEMESISKKNTWELTYFPGGAKKIGVKLIFKTKFNSNVARLDTVLMVVAIAAQNGLSIFQLDVKSTFLHGELSEDVFVEQSQGYEKNGQEHKVYKLKKALHELKQAPRAWYNKTEAYFVREGMEVQQNIDGVYLSQKKYALEVLEKFGIDKSNPPDVLDFNQTLSHVFRNKELMAYTDSDYAGDTDDRKSSSGYVFKLSSGAVAWSSKKQPVVQNKCTTLFCDNSSTINLSKNLVMHGRSKHIDVRFHFLCDLSKDGMVKLVYCSSQEQVADIMTKPLKLDVFLKLRNLLGVSSVPTVN
ncbi:hypothetical protein F3Y22_tig00111990pilonHSYRG00084 [Hibiscus syriacus]|uniref:Uncharacterized protein n=1 Tax=Hibiscus syriacus TaxID=106335 RepID=A0A6A2X7K9_HIBSY|nr:hypothetical protein F3Y22_tig00111990pilonHSYRG00084 [Hibiscus syriacus]